MQGEVERDPMITESCVESRKINDGFEEEEEEEEEEKPKICMHPIPANQGSAIVANDASVAVESNDASVSQESPVLALDDTVSKLSLNEGKEVTAVPPRTLGTTVVGLKVPSSKAVVVASDGKSSSRIQRRGDDPEYFVHRKKVQKILALSDNFAASFSGYETIANCAMKNWPREIGKYAQGKVQDRKEILDQLHLHLLGECFNAKEKNVDDDDDDDEDEVEEQPEEQELGEGECEVEDENENEDYNFCAIIGSIFDGVPQLCTLKHSGHKLVKKMYSTAGNGEKYASTEMDKFKKEMTVVHAVEIAARAVYRSGRYDRLTGGTFYAISLAYPNGSVTKYTASFDQLHEYFGKPTFAATHRDPSVETFDLPKKTNKQIKEFVEKCKKASTKMK